MSENAMREETTRESAGYTQSPSWRYNESWVQLGHAVTALAHFYRAEIQRSNTWRNRLDTTTNWAVVTTAGALTFIFSDAQSPHFVILLVILLLLVFLGIEARRYRYYELWAYRARLMETDFYASMLVPPYAPSQEWAEALADSLLHPEFTISSWEAIGRRFRRNYVWVFAVIGLSWVIKLFVHPVPATSLAEAIARAAVGPVPGPVVAGIGVAFYVALAVMGIVTATMRQSTAEVLPPAGPIWSRLLPRLRRHVPGEVRPKFMQPGRRPKQQVITIITEHGTLIAQRIMEELRRGVTRLPGQGMYTGQPRDVLLCAVSPHQVLQVKAIVREIDQHAFVIINPAEEVAGKGFDPL